ncbi:hypothetical protein CUMW_261660 [Citrus unshiu]|uniref:DOG1 domain-containing protein n=1 Tax=Citrus unshiu TaxID=55188 RepID=A0A2H5QU20_CITUN|nr:hypothetical protein CUMW_261660 [Citrus unshiu]
MASHRIGAAGGLSHDSAGPSNLHHHHVPYATSLHQSFINQEGPAFDFGELQEAIVLQGVKFRNDEATKAPLFTAAAGGRPAATLEMFPSWPMRFQQTPRVGSSKSGGESISTDSGSALNTISSGKAEASQSQLEQPESPISNINHIKPSASNQQQSVEMANDASRTGPSSSQQNQNHQSAAALTDAKPSQEKRKGPGSTSDRQLDAKTLRRLAQNREAARKSRLRKKDKAESVGARASKSPLSGAAIFDMEYARWLEDDQRHISELRSGLNQHYSDGDLRIIVDAYISHYDEIFRLKGVAAKSDVFHLITGMWTTSAERCFLWMGGFRPSELIKMLISQLDPLTEQQVMGIYSLQQSTQQAEEALSQGLEQLQQSLIETIAGGPVVDGMQQMVVALGKLENLEGFVRQADNLRQQTLHQLRRILTVRQAARCFLVIGEYYGRLRALSSLWASRPRETMISEDNSCQTTTDLQMVQHSQNHFSNF